MKTLDVAAIRAALDRLENEGVIPTRATNASAGHGGTEHIIALTVPERFSLERKHELENQIRNALPAGAEDVPIHVNFKI